MGRMITANIAIIIVATMLAGVAVAYDEVATHPIITGKAAEMSQIDRYIKSNLSYTLGLESKLKHNSGYNTVKKWLDIGSTVEDAPDELIPCRASNHFHNPLVGDWAYAGLSELWNYFCPNWLSPINSRRFSAITWATNYLEPSPDGAITSFNLVSGSNSWTKSREYYYQALTNENPIEREASFAETFVALGQTLHLLEDMGVPAHVRDDFLNSHLYQNRFRNPYEFYVKTNIDIVNNLTKEQIEAVRPRFTKPRLTQFWDANVYHVSGQPSQMPAVFTDRVLQGQAGLSEYTNANFVSEATLFKNFSYPSEQSTIQAPMPIPDPIEPAWQATRRYYIKQSPSEWETGYFLAGSSYLELYAAHYSTNPGFTLPILDDRVHDDYAKRLLPRAVGYSAALIDYFFRGQLGVSFATNGIRVKNLSKEGMTYYHDSATNNDIGMIEVYYDDSDNVRHLLNSYDLATGSINVLAPGQETPVIEFETPDDNVKKQRYIIAFKGKLRNEEGAVVGRVYVPTVYYLTTVNEVDKIARVDMDGSNRTIVADTQLANIWLGRFSLSPDGNALVFMNLVYTDGYNASILHVDLTTGLLSYLTSGNSPDWSPDGTKIVFSRELDRVGESADEQIFIRDIISGVETQFRDARSVAEAITNVEPHTAPRTQSVQQLRSHAEHGNENINGDYHGYRYFPPDPRSGRRDQ